MSSTVCSNDAVANQVEIDAKEFGRFATAVGWRLGLIAARNVEPGTGQGGGNFGPHGPKLSATEFAKIAGKSRQVVMRYHDAWKLAAEDGIVKSANKLNPGDETKLPDDETEPWSYYYSQTLVVKHSEAPVSRSRDPIKEAVRLAAQGMSYRQIGPQVGLDESVLRRNPAVREARIAADPEAHSVTVDRPTVACAIPPAREEIQRVEYALTDLVNTEKYKLSKPDAKRLLSIIRTAETELERIVNG